MKNLKRYDLAIYDSGVGGLTTLSRLLEFLPNARIYYLADNKNMPLGTKSDETLKILGEKAIKKLRKKSKICVFACNTMSLATKSYDKISLSPNLGNDHQNLVLIATNFTSKNITIDARTTHIPTRDLAQLIEIEIESLYTSKNDLKLDKLQNFVDNMLAFGQIESSDDIAISLGCSHYLYLKDLIEQSCPFATFLDGNDQLILDVLKLMQKDKISPLFNHQIGHISKRKNWVSLADKIRLKMRVNNKKKIELLGQSASEFGNKNLYFERSKMTTDQALLYTTARRVKFEFSGQDETDKYRYILFNLLTKMPL